jgi:photosystem II stability/assembly factor-like uncharacterized protein
MFRKDFVPEPLKIRHLYCIFIIFTSTIFSYIIHLILFHMKTNGFMVMVSFMVLMVLGGKTQAQWTFQSNPFGSGTNAMVGKVQFVSPSEGWISGEGKSLLHTTNGGSLWSIVTPFPNDALFSNSDPAVNLCFINSGTGWVLKTFGTGFNDAHGAVVYYTTNGGSSWQKTIITQNSGEIGFYLKFVDANNGWAGVGNLLTRTGNLYKTINGGVSWTLVNAVPMTDEVTELDFVDKNTGWMVEVNDNPARFKISKTSDGGTTWTSQYLDNISNGVDTMTSSGAIQFTDVNNGWVVGPSSRIFRTINGGTTWTKMNAGIGSNAYHKCLFMLDANNIWIGADIPDASGESKSHINVV